MFLKPKSQPAEILESAIKAEIDAADFYVKLQAKVRNELLLQKLKFLAYEEEKHRRILERLFGQRFGSRELRIPDRSFLKPEEGAFNDAASVLDLFKIALNAEKKSEEHYGGAAKSAQDPDGRRILEYLSRVERSHYFMVQSEIDLLEKYPDYYNVEKFHEGQDLFHVGP
jgi:rubrerythrin